MTKLILTGATGSAGGEVLRQALAQSQITHVTVLTRRALNTDSHPKLTTIILPSAENPKGFDELSPAVMEAVRDHTACIWALGIGQKVVSEKEYLRITVDMPIRAAEAFKTLASESQPFRFVCLSGDFVDQNEKGSNLYVNIKGRMEKQLSELASPAFQTVCLRAGGIIPTKEHAKTMSGTKLFNLYYLAPVVSTVYPRLAISSTQVAISALKLATGAGGWEMRTGEGWISCNDMKKIAKI
ncbi:MAG: hypothetical protein CYPHOPRED_000233 [Cyphobasidiales sp. Tagirdzhanova-0007]|nr:MAG: hypothetical protein CYPHOPRED_000233 [Cyphobasidiales sp. Tagirdzhanova-0007]